MKAIIPVAGFGSLLRPHTFTTPKALFKIAGKPLLDIIIDQIIEWKICEITLILGHLGDQIKEYTKSRKSIKFNFKYQDRPIGLGHAIYKGISPNDKELVIILGDAILKADIEAVVKKGITSIGVSEVEDPRKFGVVEIEKNNNQNCIKKLIEKPQNPKSNLAITGLYYIRDAQILKKAIEETIAKNITLKGKYQITDALQIMLNQDEEIQSFVVSDWIDCGKPKGLLKANRYFLRNCIEKSFDYKFTNTIINEPVYIEDNCTIENSIIGPDVSIGNGCVIRDSIVQNSILGEKATVSKIVLSETILGDRAELRSKSRKVNLGASCNLEI